MRSVDYLTSNRLRLQKAKKKCGLDHASYLAGGGSLLKKVIRKRLDQEIVILLS